MAGDTDGPSSAKNLDIIEVLVGEEKKSFTVHKNILCARSAFFKAACSERWATSPQKPIELPDDSVEIFDMYLHCVYGDKVDAGHIDSKLTDKSNESAQERTNLNFRLARTYILADKLGDVSATNKIVDEIIRFEQTVKKIPYEGVIAEVVQKLSLESPLSKLYVDYFVHHMSAQGIRYSSEKALLPEPFLYKVIEERARLCEENRNEKISKAFPSNYAGHNKCRYHQHNDEHPKCVDAAIGRRAAKEAT